MIDDGTCYRCPLIKWHQGPCAVIEPTPEPTSPSVEQLLEELKRRNQDIEDLRLTNRNLSRKIVEDQKKRELMKGIHGS